MTYINNPYIDIINDRTFDSGKQWCEESKDSYSHKDNREYSSYSRKYSYHWYHDNVLPNESIVSYGYKSFDKKTGSKTICSPYGFPSDTMIRQGSGEVSSVNTNHKFTSSGDFIHRDIAEKHYIYVKVNDNTNHISAKYYDDAILPPANFAVDIGNQLVEFSWECPEYDGIGYANECNNITSFEIFQNDILLKSFDNETLDFVHYDIPLNQENTFKIRNTNNLGETSEFSDAIVIPSIEKPIMASLTADMLSRTDSSITIVFPKVTSVTEIDTFEIVRTVHAPAVYRVGNEFDSFTDENDITETTQPCYQVRVRAYLGWSDYTNVQCADVHTEPTITQTKDPQAEILISIIPTNSDGVYLANLQYKSTNSDSLTLEYFDVGFEDSDALTRVMPEQILSNDYTQFNTSILHDGNLKPNDNNVIVQSKYEGYGMDTKKFNVDYITTLQQSNTTPNSTVDYVFTHDDQHVTYAEIDDDTTQTSCTLTDLRGVEISDDGADGIILIGLEISQPRYYIDCYVDDQKAYSDVFKTENGLKTTIATFDSIFGDFAGISIPLLFVIFVGAVFTAKNAHMGVLVLGGTIGIIGFWDF